MTLSLLRMAVVLLLTIPAAHALPFVQPLKATHEHLRQPSLAADVHSPAPLSASLDPTTSTAAPTWSTFGTGLACHTLYTDEREVWNYTVSPTSSFAALQHFWTTGSPSDWVDRALWRYYFDGEKVASIQFTASMAAGVGFPDPAAPWGNEWFGKQAKDGGWYLHFRFPFTRSVRVTGQLPADVAPGATAQLYVKLRGSEDLPIVIQGFTLPPTARMVQTRLDAVVFTPLQFVPLAAIAEGSGVLFAHTLAVESMAQGFIEGCYHAYRSFTEPYPGLVAGYGYGGLLRQCVRVQCRAVPWAGDRADALVAGEWVDAAVDVPGASHGPDIFQWRVQVRVEERRCVCGKRVEVHH